MQYRELGSTGLKVSVIGLGCEGYERSTFADGVSLLRAALDLGVNAFDMYCPNPETQRKLATALTGRRAEAVIEGHLCSIWQNGAYVRLRDIELVRAGFRQQLAALDTEYLDIGLIHYIDEEQELDPLLNGPVGAYALQLQQEGRIRELGISSHNPLVAKKAVEWGFAKVVLFSTNPAYDMQPPFEDMLQLGDAENFREPLLGIDPDRAALFAACEAHGAGITGMKVFGGGNLLSAALSPFGVALTPAQCLHYALTRPAVATVFAGCNSAQELSECAAYCQMAEAERDYAPVLAGLPLHSFCGKCVYCGHCAPCPAHIDVAAVQKFRAIAQAQGEVPATVAEHYAALAAHASDCTSCGLCERRCPFQVPVRKQMQEAATLFGC